MFKVKKSLALILAVLMFVSVVPISLAADPAVTAFTGVSVAASTTAGSLDFTFNFDAEATDGDVSNTDAKYYVGTTLLATLSGVQKPALGNITFTDKKASDVVTTAIADIVDIDDQELVVTKSYRVYASFSGNFDDVIASEPFMVVEDDKGVLSFGGFGHNITYPTGTASSFTIIGVATPDTTVADATYGSSEKYEIDLAKETLTIKLPKDISIAAYSLDGGTKWKTGSLGSEDGADISKLINKGMTLWLTTQWDASAKAPTKGVAAVAATDTTEAVTEVKGATLIKFAAINPRPKATKLTINYAIANYSDNTARTAGQWILSEKNGTSASDVSKLQIATTTDKKNADDLGWGTFTTGSGINVKTTPTGSKPERTIYLIRTAPIEGTTYTPASKAYKVTASSTLAQPKLKADYKKEIIKGKADMIVSLNDKLSETVPATLTRDTAKAGVSINDYLETGVEKTALVWRTATVKKPASSVQVIKLAPRARLDDMTLTPNKAKIRLDKSLQAKNGEKYGGLKISGNPTTINNIRKKNTAKADKPGTGYSGEAASIDGTAIVEWGKDAKGKSIITSAELIGPDYHDGNLVIYADPENLYAVASGSATSLKFGVKNAIMEGANKSSATSFSVTSGVSYTYSDNESDLIEVNGLKDPVPVIELNITSVTTEMDLEIKDKATKPNTLWKGKVVPLSVTVKKEKGSDTIGTETSLTLKAEPSKGFTEPKYEWFILENGKTEAKSIGTEATVTIDATVIETISKTTTYTVHVVVTNANEVEITGKYSVPIKRDGTGK